jgi:DNA-binding response OmpR family regulator
MRLLLVEDETALGCRVQESLEATGYTVDWAREGGEALALAREREYAPVESWASPARSAARRPPSILS